MKILSKLKRIIQICTMIVLTVEVGLEAQEPGSSLSVGGGSESSLEDKRCLEFFQTHQVFSQGTPPTHTPIKPTADLKC